MALSELIKKNSGLVSTTTEEIRAQGGTVPITGMMGDVKGVTSKSSDMLGSTANKLKTLQDSVQKAFSKDTLTTEDYAGEKARQEEAARQYAASVRPGLDKLPQINDRVKNAVLAKVTSQVTGTFNPAQVTAAIDTTKLPVGKEKETTSILTDLATGKDVAGNMLKLNNLLGRKADNQLTPVDIQNMYTNGPDAAAMGKKVADSISNYDTLKITDLGMTPADLQELSDVTGKTPEELGNLTYGDYKKATSSLRDGYTSTKNLETIMADPNAGAAQKADAAAALRESGAIGKRQTEQKVNDIVAQVEDGDKVTLGGKEVRIEEVLNDEYMSTFIKDAIDAGEDGIAELEAIAPTLGSWVRANQEALTKLVKNVEPSTGDVKEKLWGEENKYLSKIGGTSTNPQPIPGLVAPKNVDLQNSSLKWLDQGKQANNTTTVVDTVNKINGWLDNATTNNIQIGPDSQSAVGRRLASLIGSGTTPTKQQMDAAETYIADAAILADPTQPEITQIDTGFRDQVNVKQPDSEEIKALMKLTGLDPTKDTALYTALSSGSIVKMDGPALKKWKQSMIDAGFSLSKIDTALSSFTEGMKTLKTPVEEVSIAQENTRVAELKSQTDFAKTLVTKGLKLAEAPTAASMNEIKFMLDRYGNMPKEQRASLQKLYDDGMKVVGTTAATQKAAADKAAIVTTQNLVTSTANETLGQLNSMYNKVGTLIPGTSIMMDAKKQIEVAQDMSKVRALRAAITLLQNGQVPAKDMAELQKYRGELGIPANPTTMDPTAVSDLLYRINTISQKYKPSAEKTAAQAQVNSLKNAFKIR